MVEVLFYHINSKPLEQVLPVMVARTHERGQRAMILGTSEDRLRVLDDALWTFADDSFIPHGLASEPRPEDQPVLLTTSANLANRPDVLFLIDSAPLPETWDLARVVVMFENGDAEAVALARQQWQQVKALGHAATYWQQDDEGRWVKKGKGQ